VKYLLTGLARFAVCGGPMRVLPAGKDRITDTYVCQHGYHTRRSRPGLDALVTAWSWTGSPGRTRPAPWPAATTARPSRPPTRPAATRARLDTAADAYADGSIDGAHLARITAKLPPELQQWQGLARAASTAPDLLDLATRHRPTLAESTASARMPDTPVSRWIGRSDRFCRSDHGLGGVGRGGRPTGTLCR